ncbi:hypothetical protein DYB32_008210 [Aphanomyces invadans]|uniref:Mitogen-activated protein kinase n=1 Tax=Aphanomyces invadans TaxID=157072 RepID=A0A418ALS4_9STRA|nr:hypothetical protein DYB32_008210 [Aphanomyces invadans]
MPPKPKPVNKRPHAIVTKPAAAPGPPPSLLKKRRTSQSGRTDNVEVITPPKGFMDIAPTPHGPPSMMPPTPSFGAPLFHELPTPPENTTMAPPAPKSSSAASYSSSGETSMSNRSTPSPPVKADKKHATGTNAAAVPAHPKNTFRAWNVGARYRLVRILGKGSYGQVAEAYDTVVNKRVAIKKINNVFDQEVDCKRLYREIYILRHLRHSEVITLLDVLPPPSYAAFNDLYLVFEFVDTDLHKLIMSPQYLTTRHIQVFLYQLLCALKYIHSANVIHRDMKPANILVNEDCTLKVFFQRQLTKHVVTRWYRAPELILLQVDQHGICRVGGFDRTDALGLRLRRRLVEFGMYFCRAAQHASRELLAVPGIADSNLPRSVVFSPQRRSTNNLDQLNVIFNVIGTPSEDDIGNLGEVTVKQYLRKLQHKDPMNLAQVRVMTS